LVDFPESRAKIKTYAGDFQSGDTNYSPGWAQSIKKESYLAGSALQNIKVSRDQSTATLTRQNNLFCWTGGVRPETDLLTLLPKLDHHSNHNIMDFNTTENIPGWKNFLNPHLNFGVITGSIHKPEPGIM
jgi:hypothetical protein